MQITVSLLRWNQIIEQLESCEQILCGLEDELLQIGNTFTYSEDLVMHQIEKSLKKEQKRLSEKIRQIHVLSNILTGIQELYCDTEEMILEASEPLPKMFSEISGLQNFEQLKNLVTPIFDTGKR